MCIRDRTYCIDAGIAALKAHYARCGVAVDDVTLIPGTPGYYKTDYTMAHPGRVSILIPTCDHIRDLETCVESIYARTTYPDFEILLIENNSKEEQDVYKRQALYRDVVCCRNGYDLRLVLG